MQTYPCKISLCQQTTSILGNLTNSNTPNSQSPLTQKSPGFQKTSNQSSSKYMPIPKNLEQENLELKSQIELLKTALLDICKDKNLHLPQIAPIIGDVLQQENLAQREKYDGRASPFQNVQFKHSTPLISRQAAHRLSPKKSQQPKQTVKESQLFQNENGSSISQINLNHSPIKSLQRRKRAARTQTHKQPPMESFKTSRVVPEHSPRFNEELPLQMNKVKKNNLNPDDTLMFDKTLDIVVRPQEVLPANLGEVIVNEVLFFKEDDIKDSTQIQIKYAKMLEELDNDSIEEIAHNSHVFHYQGQSKMEEYKSVDGKLICYPKQMSGILDKSITSKGKHQKNSSSQFEQKQFYENQLNHLKTELEQFAQEEEKLLQMLSPHDQEQIIQDVTEQTKVQVEQNSVHTFEPFNEVKVESYGTYGSNEQERVFKSIDNEVLIPAAAYTDLQDFQALQKNLKEAAHFMSLDEQEDPYRIIIKPIKINSPVEKMVCEYVTEHGTVPRSRVNAFDRESTLQQTVSPRRKGSITSFDCQSEQTIMTTQNAQYQCKSPYYYEKQAKVQIVDQSPQASLSCYRNQSSQKSKRQLASARSNQSRQSIKNAGVAKASLIKNPSQYMTNLLDKMAQSSSKRYLSPIKHLLPHTYQPQTEASVSHYEENFEMKSLSQAQSSEKVNKIDMLAQQQQSLASGLKQQQEPSEDEEYISLRIATGAVEESKQPAQSEIIEYVQDEESMYFGLYSVEKSEELKKQRQESIKKAEQLLAEYLQDKIQSRRPNFYYKSLSKKQEEEQYDEPEEEVEEVVVEEIGDSTQSYFKFHRQSQNEIEPPLPENTMRMFMPQDVLTPYKAADEEDLYQELSRQPSNFLQAQQHDYEVINLQITPDRQASTNKKIYQYGKELSPYDETRDGHIDPNMVDIQKDNYQSFDIANMNIVHQESASSLPHPALQHDDIQSHFNKTVYMDHLIAKFHQESNPFQETQLLQPQIKQPNNNAVIMSNRRKSVETKLSSTQNIMNTSNKRKSMQNKKMAQIIRDPDSTKEDSYYQMKVSNSTEKYSFKAIEKQALSCTHLNLKQSGQKIKCIVETVSNPAFIDAEQLYSVRSKSVIKRREDMLKKKQEESKQKLDEKYQKIDKIKQNKNMFRVQSNQKYSNSIVANKEDINKKSVNVQQQPYSSNKKSAISREDVQSSTKKKEFNNSAQIVDVQSKTLVPVRQEKKLQEKRDSISSIKQVQSLIQPPSIQQQVTPIQCILATRSPISLHPLSKASKVSSQCTSHRFKEDPIQFPQSKQGLPFPQMLQKHQESSKDRKSSQKTPSCNLLYKQKLQTQLGIKAVQKNQRLNKSKESAHAYQEHSNTKSLHSTIEYEKTTNVTQSNSFVDGKQIQHKKNQSSQNTKSSYTSRSMVKVPSSYQSIYNFNAPTNQDKVKAPPALGKSECKNCERLKFKGLSTDFCLEHYDKSPKSPRYIDD